jgi:hypothetical protein
MPLLSVLPLFPLQLRAGEHERPGWGVLGCAVIFVGASVWMLFFAFRKSPTTIAWVVVVGAAALVGYLLSRRRLTGGQ